MTENTTLGTVVEFAATADVDIVMKASRPSKDDCLVIGWAYFEAATRDGFGTVAEGGCRRDEADMDALLEEHDPILVRRSLKVFANYASRTGQREVAEYAALLRDEIKVVTGNEAVS